MEELNDSLWAFSLELFKHLRNENPNANLFYSPLSVCVTLSTALLGAKGETAAEILSALDVKKEKETDWHTFLSAVSAPKEKSLTVANKIFVEKTLAVLESYGEVLRKYYGVDHGEVSFAGDPKGAVLSINKWASDATKGKIPNLLDDVDEETRVVLVNAVHFKGEWKYRFDKRRTADAPFHVSSTEVVTVPLMFRSFKVPFYCGPLGSAIRMSFREDDFSILLMLPGRYSSLEQLEDTLIDDKSQLKAVLQECSPQKVDVAIPRFKLKWSQELTGALRQCGIGDLFNQSACDLSGVTDSGELHVSAVVQEAVLEVNEKGARAISVTAPKMNLFLSASPEFVADSPFLVAILRRDNVVFLGRVIDPTAK